MGGRGWGGKGSSLTVEQLQSMGVGRGEGPGPTLAPPPLYPKLENPPLPLNMDASMDYMLILKKQFIEFLNDSPVYVRPDAVKSNVERYSDKYKVLSVDGKSSKASCFNWKRMPRELRPPQERQSNLTKGVKRKLSKQLDVNLRLKKLEELEKNVKNEGENVEDSGNADKNSSDDEDKESEKEEVEDPDEEMDDGTDYVDNYFDNGEAFDEEDDNLDDGPVY